MWSFDGGSGVRVCVYVCVYVYVCLKGSKMKSLHQAHHIMACTCMVCSCSLFMAMHTLGEVMTSAYTG